jgi:hypothetical protein
MRAERQDLFADQLAGDIGGLIYGKSEEKSTLRSVFHKTLAVCVEAVARHEAWFNPFGNDHAIPGLW